MAGGTLIRKEYVDFDSYGGSSPEDSNSLMHYLLSVWYDFFNEVNSSLTIDQTSITPAVGMNPGTYENMWLFPQELVAGPNDWLATLMGPIEATVTVGVDGSIESIVPTLKNGCYITGETLLLMTGREVAIGIPSSPITCVLTAGSESQMNLAGHKLWNQNSSVTWTSISWTVSICFDRVDEVLDARYLCVMWSSGSVNSSTNHYSNYYHIQNGWNTEYGRSAFTGTYGNNYASFATIAAPSGADPSLYVYYNSTPGSECFLYGDTYYGRTFGFYKTDTSQGFIGTQLYSTYGRMYGDYHTAMPYNAESDDGTFGYPTQSLQGGVTRVGYFKPLRSLEADNFVVSGSNENLAITTSQTPMFSTWKTPDDTIKFRKFANYLGVRV